MSFREPAVLLGLLLLPLAALAYAVMQRRKRADAARVRQPGAAARARHRAPGLAPPPAAAAAARRARRAGRRARAAAAHASPRRSAQATVVLVTDVSGSMRANDVEPDRLSAAVEAGQALADKLPDKFRLGLVTFSDYAEQTVPPTTERGPVKDALDRLVADGGTAMGDALRARHRVRADAGRRTATAAARAGCRR